MTDSKPIILAMFVSLLFLQAGCARQDNTNSANGSMPTPQATPDIQATALRLKDSEIVGQAASSDVVGKERSAGYYARNFDVREIAEATALALMEDMLTGADTK